MERKIQTSSEFFEGLSYGVEPVDVWVEEKLSLLRGYLGLPRVEVDSMRFDVSRLHIQSDSVDEIVGESERGDEAMGFIAEFYRGRLTMLLLYVEWQGKLIGLSRSRNKEWVNAVDFRKAA